MAGGQKFSKIDLAQAYLQMKVRQEDREILTLNTHLGLYQPIRLMYGVASAPAIFQREISHILADIPGVSVFLDYVKITGPDDETHLYRLEQVLHRLDEYGMRVNISKCEFYADQIEYCGFIINKDGIKKMKAKVDAIQNMPRPQDRDQLPLVVATDASPYGVGAILSHLYPDGTEKPIQYALQTLNKTQQKYMQVDKEAYAIIFGVKKIYQYLYGRRFILVTDNKPVSQIFSPDKGLPALSAVRMQHYALFLESLDYEIRYRPSKDNANADAMSRLPVQDEDNKNCIEVADVIELNQIETLPVTVDELAESMKNDSTVRNLLQGLKVGRVVDGRDRFGVDQAEFSIQQGCILKGIRVYIPPKLRKRVLDELHTGHFGVSRMKSLARSYCWWERVDKDIEELAKNCVNCAGVRKNPVKVPPHCWERPSEPFQRIYVNYAGPLLGHYFLVIIDAFTKWPEVKVTRDMTTDTTVDCLREYFATYGVPTVMVSDRGVQFTSHQFQAFLKANNVVHKMGAPYHPATNGQAERFVQTFKDKLKALKCERKDILLELSKILMAYRRTVHPATGKSPSMLVFGRQIRSRLDLIIPKCAEQEQLRGEEPNVRCFDVGDKVAARVFLSTSKWRFGTITEKLGKLHYAVELDDGRVWKRHIDQLRSVPIQTVPDSEPDISVERNRNTHHTEKSPVHVTPCFTQPLNEESSGQPALVSSEESISSNAEIYESPPNSEVETGPGPRRSTRARKPPNRLNL
ncbi:uncharacterized protein K02A2.6-like [Sabethes cyaneus]|uniref:uncharacterized protein K02A2.6-like n=1 Tax=Sabethes cyaneus TaxID=53552 RepID=UPI00237DD45F|nr:uncharacterized protein K02A2.6-like [Sabethes cyaneus]